MALFVNITSKNGAKTLNIAVEIHDLNENKIEMKNKLKIKQ